MSFSKLQLSLFSLKDQYNSFHQLLKPLWKLWANKQACQKLTGETHARFYARGEEKCVSVHIFSKSMQHRNCWQLEKMLLNCCDKDPMADICINWVLIIRRRIHCSEPGAIEDLAKTFEFIVSGRQMRERDWLISDCGIWRAEDDIWPRPQSRIILPRVHIDSITHTHRHTGIQSLKKGMS